MWEVLWCLQWDKSIVESYHIGGVSFTFFRPTNKTKNCLATKQVAAAKILEEMSTAKTSELHKEIAQLKEGNERLRSFNMKLQEELLNCLSEARRLHFCYLPKVQKHNLIIRVKASNNQLKFMQIVASSTAKLCLQGKYFAILSVDAQLWTVC